VNWIYLAQGRDQWRKIFEFTQIIQFPSERCEFDDQLSNYQPLMATAPGTRLYVSKASWMCCSVGNLVKSPSEDVCFD
jgi:hypothetical protein